MVGYKNNLQEIVTGVALYLTAMKVLFL